MNQGVRTDTLGQTNMPPDLKRPWCHCEGDFSARAVEELKREVGPLHPLKEKNVSAVAFRCDCDDVLFLLGDASDAVLSCAVVHLTRSGKQEPLNWPETHLYESLDQWKQQCMIPDCEDYSAGA